MKTLILSLLLAAAVVACSENPLDPDQLGQVRTAFDDLLAESCTAVCQRIADCGCPVDMDQCVPYCEEELSQEEQAAIAAMGCAEVAAAFCAGG